MDQTAKQVQITKDGLQAIEKEVRSLQGEKRPKLVERLSYARQQGDLAENSDYHNAKEELEFLDGRISELEEVLKNAKVVKSNGKTNEVALGTTVTLSVKAAKYTYNIVGEWEADPAAKKISHTSPLGQALIGKKVGETVEVEAPAGKLSYKILTIN